MTAFAPFDAPRAKIARARHHISTLETELQNYATEAFATDQKRDFQTGDLLLNFPAQRGLPSDVPLMLGDAIHNLRAALDLLACDIVRMAGKSTKNVYFPFASNAGEFEGQIKKKTLIALRPKRSHC